MVQAYFLLMNNGLRVEYSLFSNSLATTQEDVVTDCYRPSEQTCCLYLHSGTVRQFYFKTLLTRYQTTRRPIPKGSNIYSKRHEKLKTSIYETDQCTDMRRLTTGIRYEKYVVRRFRGSASVKECTYTNLDSIAYYTTRLYGIAYCS
jgi:hypothetical protein